MMILPITAFIIALVGSADPVEPLVGRVSVIDGDTLELHGQRIRIWGVDAPESRQVCHRGGAEYRCGQLASNRLDNWIGDRTVSCQQQSRDRYRRIVARCRVGGEDIGGWLVRHGYAVRYPEYAGTAYIVEEQAARVGSEGVWQGTFENPWDWRRARRSR